jgi:hypothetical protein
LSVQGVDFFIGSWASGLDHVEHIVVKREHDTSMGNTTINAKGEIKTVALPETFSSFDTTRDTR